MPNVRHVVWRRGGGGYERAAPKWERIESLHCEEARPDYSLTSLVIVIEVTVVDGDGKVKSDQDEQYACSDPAEGHLW